MSVTKLKPAKTPRVMDEWTEEKALACEESKRTALNAIEKSKQLIEQSKEIKARVTASLKKDSRRRKIG